MRSSKHIFVVLATFLSTALGLCSKVLTDFKGKTQISCPIGQYMEGLTRGKISGYNDKIDDIVQIDCCPQSEGLMRASIVDYAEWVDTFDEDNNWSACPPGYFVQGLQRGTIDKLDGIQAGRCAKPVDHPHSYETCYVLDVDWTVNENAYVGCSNNSFVVSFYRGGGNDLSDLDKLRCCQMVQPPELNTIDGVKTLVRDKTRPGLADLAHFLGFGWCFGCRALNVGEHFDESENGWIASTNGDCANGDRKNNRLKIKYGNWRMVTANITYGEVVVEDLKPQREDSGTVINDASPATRYIMGTMYATRSVSHFKQKEWEDTTDIDVVFINPILDPDAVAEYSFSYKDATKTKDTTGQKHTDKFEYRNEVTLPPYTTYNYTWNLKQTRYTVPYTALIMAECSVTLESFLRGGMGKNPGANYHEDYNGKTGHPDFSYTFGDETTSFVNDLNQEYNVDGSGPWLWSQVKNAWPDTDLVVKDLLDKAHYEFTVSGEFVQVVGTGAELVESDIVEYDPVVGKRDLPSVTFLRGKENENFIDLGEITVIAHDN